MPVIDTDNMVLNDINADAVTNDMGTGVFDKLMSAVNDDINVQYQENRINSTDYATVYLGSLQAVLAQSIQFVLQEQTAEAQISSILKDNELKAKQIEVADVDIALKQFELNSMMPEQLIKIQEEIDLLQTQDSELGLNGTKDRLIKDADISMKAKQEDLIDSQITGSGFDNTLKSEQAAMSTYERTVVQPKQLEKLEEEIDMLQSQDLDVIAKTAIAVSESAENVLLKQEQIESEALNNKVDGVIENQIKKLKEDILVSKEEVEIAKTKTALEQANSIANIDKVLGYNYTLDVDGNIVVGTTTGEGKLDYDKLLVKEQTESENLKNQADGVIANQILDIKKGVDVKERQMSEAEATGTKQRLIMDEEIETAGLQQAILGTEEELKTAQKDEVLAGTVRADTTLSDTLLTTAKQRILLDEEVETADLQQIILGTEEELKTSQNLEVIDSTVRANTQLDDALLTSDEQRDGMYTERVLKDKQAAKLGLDNTMKLSEAAREADANFVYSPNYTEA